MPAREEIFHFGAGPARLPTSVLARASVSILNHEDTGLGLAEHSHRSALCGKIVTDAVDSLKTLLSIPDDYSVIFMQGGGTSQFSGVVYNLLGYWMDYLVTGVWSQKASEEASRLAGEWMVNVAVNAKEANGGKYGKIPAEDTWKLTEKEKSIFTYFCDNETVDGVEFPAFPTVLAQDKERLVVADMSSNILSRRVDVSKYAVIFAGAQKNVGTTGLTMVIIRNDILANQPTLQTQRALGLPIQPIMFDYKTLAKNGSLYNTLPIFDVWIAKEVMQDLIAGGGLEKQEEISGRKSDKLYAALEASPEIYKIVTVPGSRSRMNICYRISGEGLEDEFVKLATKQGMTGLKGHRSVGGIRISNYNSITEEGADKLAAYIREFAESHKV
ncbi:phosphoserine aminotransferase [Morchella conica CCBAS932]|uniref:phosphoserine transaminase n=1 Tax=Morchella conica CCBAS932 TaxID=1392247 RepID=A0A3N4L9T2_9PEZI|nr:phosphoserine aminotransferase [Morchella conica CCBAS932]